MRLWWLVAPFLAEPYCVPAPLASHARLAGGCLLHMPVVTVKRMGEKTEQGVRSVGTAMTSLCRPLQACV